GDFEVYDYPGEYETSGTGETYARVRLEELQTLSERAEGFANARGISTGALFTLTEHPTDAQNREYLILSVSFTIETHALESDQGDDPGEEDVFQCRFLAADSQRPFRPARRARKPVVRGAQTAIVTGKSGEEIWTDQFGRVKVKFHWDRSDAADENSSCWVRVAQVWAGTNWGAMHIPRIGQEVIVEFLEGDPDRPIITGRVYNGDNMPPYALPANQTQSGIKSRSTKGGGASNANEIRFEDKKGAEQLYIQAEKNQDILVKASESHSVGGSRTKSIGADETVTIGANRTETVGADETITVGANRTETVGASETITIGASRTETVGSTESITVALARTTTVGAADVLNVGGAQMVDVGAAQAITVGAIRKVTVGGAESVSVGASQKIDVGANQSVSVGGKQNVDVGGDVTLAIKGGRSANISKDDAIQAGQKLTLVAADEITLKSGSASIVLKKSGDIVIKGKNIVLDASAKINIKASGDIVMKGSKIGQN
ncbi:MAG TPA: type VI secretion system tip protein TssI/VgrG, partial [Polyangiaceae bacterium]